MSDYAVAQLDEIEEMSDGRCPWQPVRHHFGNRPLRRAIEISERSRTYAKDDSDFDPIRNEPAFKELIRH